MQSLNDLVVRFSAFTYVVAELKRNLASSFKAQHGSAVGVPIRTVCVRLAIFAHVRCWPFFPPERIVLVVHVSLAGQIVGRVQSLAVPVAQVGAAAMGKVR